jgi:hypothetical protein
MKNFTLRMQEEYFIFFKYISCFLDILCNYMVLRGFYKMACLTNRTNTHTFFFLLIIYAYKARFYAVFGEYDKRTSKNLALI